MEIKSTQNQPFKYLHTILLPSVTNARPPVLSRYASRKLMNKSLRKQKSMTRLMKNRASKLVCKKPTSNGVTVAVQINSTMVTYSHLRMYVDRGSTIVVPGNRHGRSSSAACAACFLSVFEAASASSDSSTKRPPGAVTPSGWTLAPL